MLGCLDLSFKFQISSSSLSTLSETGENFRVSHRCCVDHRDLNFKLILNYPNTLDTKKARWSRHSAMAVKELWVTLENCKIQHFIFVELEWWQIRGFVDIQPTQYEGKYKRYKWNFLRHYSRQMCAEHSAALLIWIMHDWKEKALNEILKASQRLKNPRNIICCAYSPSK